MMTSEEFHAKYALLGSKPRIWYRIPGYVIRNYSPDLEEYVMDLIKNVFVKEEPTFSVNDTFNDPISMAELKVLFGDVLNKNLNTLVAIPENTLGADLKPVPTNNPVVIAGVNIIIGVHKDDPPHSHRRKAPSGVAWKKTLKMLKNFGSRVNVFEKYDTNCIIETAGLMVHKDHRRRGLSKALIRARFPLCRELGVQVTKTIFTSKASHKAALSCGFQFIDTVRFCDLKDANGELICPHCSEEHVFQLAVKIID